MCCLIPALSFAQEWEYHSTEDGVKVYTLDQSHTTLKRIKVEATIDGSLGQVGAAIRDVENMPLWYDMVSGVEVVDSISATELRLQLVIDMPWPIRDRYSGLYAYGSYDAEERSLDVATKYDETIVIDLPSTGVLVTEMGSRWSLREVSAAQVLAIHEVYIDPEGLLPDWLVNYAATDGPVRTMLGLRKMIASYPTDLDIEHELGLR